MRSSARSGLFVAFALAAHAPRFLPGRSDAMEYSALVFLPRGGGGGPGTGAIPIIADIAQELGALTIAVVTKPFTFEGSERRKIAEDGWQELQGRVDALISIPNDKLLSLIHEETTLEKAFLICDDVLRSAVQGISDIVTTPGIVNVDFADVRTVLKHAGIALLGVGSARGQDRASKAAHFAIHSPLFETSLEGARSILFNISGDRQLAMSEVYTVARIIADSADQDSKIIFGAVVNPSLARGELKVTVIGAGFKGQVISQPKSTSLFSQVSRLTPQAATESTSRKGVQPQEIPEEERELHEIPAFLRKRKPRVL